LTPARVHPRRERRNGRPLDQCPRDRSPADLGPGIRPRRCRRMPPDCGRRRCTTRPAAAETCSDEVASLDAVKDVSAGLPIDSHLDATRVTLARRTAVGRRGQRAVVVRVGVTLDDWSPGRPKGDGEGRVAGAYVRCKREFEAAAELVSAKTSRPLTSRGSPVAARRHASMTTQRDACSWQQSLLAYRKPVEQDCCFGIPAVQVRRCRSAGACRHPDAPLGHVRSPGMAGAWRRDLPHGHRRAARVDASAIGAVPIGDFGRCAS
jgi:hypothetical protein